MGQFLLELYGKQLLEKSERNEKHGEELVSARETITNLQRESEYLKSQELPKIERSGSCDTIGSEDRRESAPEKTKKSYKMQLPMGQDDDDTDNTGSDFSVAFDDELSASTNASRLTTFQGPLGRYVSRRGSRATSEV